MTRRALLGLLLLVAGAACYVAVVVARQGPPPGGDTTPLTTVTSALATGQLHAAASEDGLPNPPGYALLTAPFVAAFPSLVGAPTWCLTTGRAAALHRQSSYDHDPNFAIDVNECGTLGQSGASDVSSPWYRGTGPAGRARLARPGGRRGGHSSGQPRPTRRRAWLGCSPSSRSGRQPAAPSSSSTIHRTS